MERLIVMKNFTLSKKSLFLALSLLLSHHVIASSNITDCAEDNFCKKAAAFFKRQIDFTTNAPAVKKVVDGSVKNVTLVDVRDSNSYNKSHIPGAINVPFSDHMGPKGPFTGDETEFSKLRKEGFNYVYCYTPECNLALMACQKFSELGYRVKEVKGGFTGWTDHDYPVEPFAGLDN